MILGAHRIDCDLDEYCWCYDENVVPVSTVATFLDANHYLGATNRGIAWSDEFGVLVLAMPTSRRLPHDGTWLELSRWCLLGEKNAGSRQWKKVRRWLRKEMPHVTTVVSYSDPSQGHTGALYKACNWKWAPTWLRLRPPPSGNGSWITGEQQSVKDRWVFPVRRDARRSELLRVNDEALNRRGIIGYEES
jgi:hypothetical protein